jgi:hypothetical protein
MMDAAEMAYVVSDCALLIFAGRVSDVVGANVSGMKPVGLGSCSCFGGSARSAT